MFKKFWLPHLSFLLRPAASRLLIMRPAGSKRLDSAILEAKTTDFPIGCNGGRFLARITLGGKERKMGDWMWGRGRCREGTMEKGSKRVMADEIWGAVPEVLGG